MENKKSMTFELVNGQMVQRKRTFMERLAVETPSFVAPIIVLVCFILQVKIGFLIYPFLKALINLIP